MKLLSVIIYAIFFLPVWAFMCLTGLTRFGRRYHNRKSTWDQTVAMSKTTTHGPDTTQVAIRGGNP